MKLTPEQTQEWFAKRYEHLGVTQEEFALLVNITGSDLARYKQQKAQPRPDKIERLAAGFGVDILSMYIVLGLIDGDDGKTPIISKGQKNSKYIWKL